MFITTFSHLLSERCHALNRGNIRNHFFLHLLRSLFSNDSTLNHSKKLFTIKTMLRFYYHALSIRCSATRPISFINHFPFYVHRFISCIKSFAFVFLEQFLYFGTPKKYTQLSSVFNLQSTERNSRLYFVRFQPLNCLQLLEFEIFLVN